MSDGEVVVVSAEELLVFVADNPLVQIAADPSRLLVVAFLSNSADSHLLEPLLADAWAPEAIASWNRSTSSDRRLHPAC